MGAYKEALTAVMNEMLKHGIPGELSGSIKALKFACENADCVEPKSEIVECDDRTGYIYYCKKCDSKYVNYHPAYCSSCGQRMRK